MILPDLPERLRGQLELRHGPPLSVEPLAGVVRSSAARVRFRDTSVIVKWSDRIAESRFYEHAAPVFVDHGIPAPALELSWHSADTHWIVLEDVPHPLPRSRWLADPELLAILGRLHTLAIELPTEVAHRYAPQWTEDMTEAALACFRAAAAAEMRPSLMAIQQEYQGLFVPQCLISGDPNPTNWGLRDNGELVLFDWERVGYGTPALDLAITVPGFGDGPAFRLVAERYLAAAHAGQPRTMTPARLAEDIAVAKIWSIVEFLGTARRSGFREEGDASSPIRDIVAAFPDWLSGLDAW